MTTCQMKLDMEAGSGGRSWHQKCRRVPRYRDTGKKWLHSEAIQPACTRSVEAQKDTDEYVSNCELGLSI